MIKKKKTYESPDTQVTQVELESSICNGSVDFKEDGTNKGVTISSQTMATPTSVGEGGALNDFTDDSWITPANNN